MDLKAQLIKFSAYVENVLIGWILLNGVLLFFIFKEASITPLLMNILLIIQGALLLFYIFLSGKSYFGLVLITMLAGIAGILFKIYYLQLAGNIGAAIFGIFVIIEAVKESVKNSNFELMTFLLGFFLALNLGLFLLDTQELGIFYFYSFGLCFIIATIMYNDNLWDKFELPQKKIIIFILITALLSVFRLSSKSF